MSLARARLAAQQAEAEALDARATLAHARLALEEYEDTLPRTCGATSCGGGCEFVLDPAQAVALEALEAQAEEAAIALSAAAVRAYQAWRRLEERMAS